MQTGNKVRAGQEAPLPLCVPLQLNAASHALQSTFLPLQTGNKVRADLEAPFAALREHARKVGASAGRCVHCFVMPAGALCSAEGACAQGGCSSRLQGVLACWRPLSPCIFLVAHRPLAACTAAGCRMDGAVVH